MRTDDLIDTLAADLAPRRPLSAALAVACAAGIAATLALFLAGWGPRADLAAATESLRFLAKPLVGMLLAIGALGLAVRLAHPGAPARGWAMALAAAPLAAAAFVALELAALPARAWAPALLGENALVCLVSIPALALPMLVALVYGLKGGAPVRPGLAGAVVGLAAAGVAAALYAVFCTDDSPLFVATWYTLAAGIVAAAGAIAGRRWLRW
ncbi:NrsF family protein [Salinarimonas chemoclinalis]|uniref:NrsF family protein n=1 Tax=Salinarimonas chemoclinalis TaxID=3241599 RepID=UPI0035584200